MRRSFDPGAKIFRRSDQTLAKIGLPELVDGGASGGGAIGSHNPMRQAEAIARCVSRKGREHSGRVGLNFLLGSQAITALEKVSDTRLGPLLEHQRCGGIWPVVPGGVDL